MITRMATVAITAAAALSGFAHPDTTVDGSAIAAPADVPPAVTAKATDHLFVPVENRDNPMTVRFPAPPAMWSRAT